MTATNLFGTFLDTLSKDAPEGPPGADPHVDRILKMLVASSKPLAMKDLMPAADFLPSVLLGAIAKLESMNVIERVPGDSVQLTGLGRDLAALAR